MQAFNKANETVFDEAIPAAPYKHLPQPTRQMLW